jgi:hypothetical protein
MPMKKLLLLLIVVFAGISVSHAQDINLGKGFKKDKIGKAQFAQAEEFFENGSYLQALPLYRALEPKYGTNQYLEYKIGICLLYKSDETNQALEYLLRIKTQNPKAADIDLYLAHAYHLNERYDEALASLDEYDAGKDNTPSKAGEAKHLREYCNNAKELTAHPVEAKIINISDSVNTANSEYVPVISIDDSVMLFTYRGERSTGGLQSYPGMPDSAGIYFEDVFFTARQGNGWMTPEPLDSTINGDGHDACIGISNDGQTLLIYKDDDGNGDIYVSRLDGFYWSAPVPLKGQINSPSWEGSATFSADMHTIYFASEREGGYGGRDIWMATLQGDSLWTNVKNMGPKINTQYNEDAPFLHPNGVTLLFSSEGHNSMGGYDIFRTDLTPLDSTFSDASEPVNLGYPINTPGDDKYFVLATDGKHGYYSSGKSGGHGQQDIYQVNVDFDLKNVNVMLLNGYITYNGKPVEANIDIKDQSGKLRTVNLYSKGYTGRYAVTLPLNHVYTVTYSLDGSASQVRVIDSLNGNEMLSKVIDIQFYSKAWQDSLRDIDSLAAVKKRLLETKLSILQIDTSMFKTFPLDSMTLKMLNPYDYALILSHYGNAKAPGLIFHVQVAAYNFPDNYRYDFLRPIGNIDTRVLDDKITRFTMGSFETLNEAEAYRQKIVAAGQTDAFVTAEMQGRRYTIRDLVLRHFFQPEFAVKP